MIRKGKREREREAKKETLFNTQREVKKYLHTLHTFEYIQFVVCVCVCCELLVCECVFGENTE